MLIHVAAGALCDPTGRVLIARRAPKGHQGGLWEFPGGKLEPDETPTVGLARELLEELGIGVTASRPLIQVRHDYGDRHILLDVHLVTGWEGTPEGREGQPLAWVHPDAMNPAGFPAADHPVILALRLPPTLLITGPDPRHPADFLARLDLALAAGPRLVQLRAHELDDDAYAGLARAVAERCRASGVRLLLSRDPDQAAALLDAGIGAAGLHLSARRLLALDARPGPTDWLIGASCHDAGELAHAGALGLDYALLSPLRPTASHPGAPGLGWPGFAALVADANLPVYALGGLGPDDLDEAFAHGAQGIAAIGAWWLR